MFVRDAARRDSENKMGISTDYCTRLRRGHVEEEGKGSLGARCIRERRRYEGVLM